MIFFSLLLPESTFSSGSLSYDACVPPGSIACINICAHVEDPVVQVRGRWIIETLKQPAHTVGWVARLCSSRLSPGEIPMGQYSCLRKKERKRIEIRRFIVKSVEIY